MSRVVIQAGRLVTFHGVRSEIWDGDRYVGPVVESSYWLEYQLRDEAGKRAAGDYRGPGTVSESGGRHVVILGDVDNPHAFLTEYAMDAEPTAVSLQRADDYEAGFKRGANPRRRLPRTASSEFRDGFRDGRDARAKQRAAG